MNQIINFSLLYVFSHCSYFYCKASGINSQDLTDDNFLSEDYEASIISDVEDSEDHYWSCEENSKCLSDHIQWYSVKKIAGYLSSSLLLSEDSRIIRRKEKIISLRKLLKFVLSTANSESLLIFNFFW